jgi:isoleucyl-tRNA synthetase
MAFKPVNPKVSFPALEQDLLKFWQERNILQKSIDQREKGQPGARGDYVFFDGPPGTNSPPHIGHMMQSALKDLWPRFKTMQGFRVLRKAGWDTHGLPIELQAEKELGLDSKRDIHNYGMTKYVAYCRNTVFRYLKEWEKAIKRIGRFLDLSDAYATLTNDYIQTDWWVIKQAHKKGLLYKDFKILPYCSRCGTGLSSHEVAQGYQDVTDTSVFVAFKLKDEPDTSLLIWTTTPWTLIANVAVAVGPEVKYVRVRREGGQRLIVAKNLAQRLFGDEKVEVEEQFDGHALVGKHYEPPYNFFKPKEKAFYVVAEDFVTTEDGSGLVHMAAYGEDDYKVIKKYKLPLIQHLDLEGRLKAEVGAWQGKSFKEVDKEVVGDLKERGLLFKAQPHKHSYPFCWRCKTPLIYNAQSSWFIKTTELRKKMIAANKKINWQPTHIRDGRFGKWLEGNVDWAISRARYWGSPLPVWVCQKNGHLTVVESLDELRTLATEKLPADETIDLHKPFIDTVTLKCQECDGLMKREPDVLDCWFNAGVMPWGQWGYPSKPGSKKLFDSQYPADFICEGIDQTRGWFYVLLAASTMLTGKSSYKNVICTGFKLDEKGRKMSKSLGNVVEPVQLFEKFGADAVRWTFFRTDPWLSSRFGERTVTESISAVIRPLWNVYSFFVTYANIDKFEPASTSAPKSTNVLDRWILLELDDLTRTVTQSLEDYDVAPASAAFEKFIDRLSNWYVRRGRRRFWKSENDGDKKSAEATLYYVLVTLSKLLAPFVPFVSEEIYGNLTGGGLHKDQHGKESVHLEAWPKARSTKISSKDKVLLDDMRRAQQVASLALAARQNAEVRVRQPLQRLVVAFSGKDKLSAESQELIKDEINVKEVQHEADPQKLGHPVVKLNFAVAGKKYGSKVKEMQKTLASAPVAFAKDGSVTVDEYKLQAQEVLVTYQGKKGLAVVGDRDVLVALDTTITPQLEEEGIARELIREIQDLRKAAKLEVTDRISAQVTSQDTLVQSALKNFSDLIKKETLATSLTLSQQSDQSAKAFELDGHGAKISVAKSG